MWLCGFYLFTVAITAQVAIFGNTTFIASEYAHERHFGVVAVWLERRQSAAITQSIIHLILFILGYILPAWGHLVYVTIDRIARVARLKTGYLGVLRVCTTCICLMIGVNVTICIVMLLDGVPFACVICELVIAAFLFNVINMRKNWPNWGVLVPMTSPLILDLKKAI
jgi:hypothetical protein